MTESSSTGSSGGLPSSRSSTSSAKSRSSSSTSRSSSGATSRSGAGRVPPARRGRTATNREDWGVNFFTMRRSQGTLTGWQVTCMNPKHFDKKCSKEISNRVSGSSEISKRMLMQWVILGSSTDSRDAHIHQWHDIVDQKRQGKLASLEELNDACITDWEHLPPKATEIIRRFSQPASVSGAEPAEIRYTPGEASSSGGARPAPPIPEAPRGKRKRRQ